MKSEKKVGLARQAYVGAPRGVSHVWPDYIDHTPRPDWALDEREMEIVRRAIRKFNQELRKAKRRAILDSL